MLENTKVETLSDDFKAYIRTHFKLLQLQFTERVAVLSAGLINYLIVGIASLFCLFFLSISLGIYLSILLENYLLGFLLVSGFYLLMIFILLLSNKNLVQKPIINMLISKLLNTN